MSRRSSSLVTISLDDVSTAEEFERRPNIPSPVIMLGDDEENHTSSTERMIEITVDVCPQEPGLEQAELDPVGTCSKIKSWFQNCQIQCNCFYCQKPILEFFRKKLEQLREKLGSKCSKSYLETYFLYANVFGVSPFRFDKENQRVVWLKKVCGSMKITAIENVPFFGFLIMLIHLLTVVPLTEARKNNDSPRVVAKNEKAISQMIPYYIVNTLAAVDTGGMAKIFLLSMIGAHEERSADIRVYLNNSLTGANILLRVGFFVSMKYYAEKYSKVIHTICTSSYHKPLYTVKIFAESLLLCGSSLCVVLIKTHSGLLDGINTYIIANANYALSVFCLPRSCQAIDMDNLSSVTIALGLLGWATDFAGNLFQQIARDSILFSALALGKTANAFRFKRRVKNTTSVEDAITIGTEINTDFKWIKKISKHTNSAFNTVFRFFLLANIFMFAVFIDEWFDKQMEKPLKAAKLTNIVCVCITFYYANQTAKTGDRFREWMKKEKNRNILGMSEMNVMTENSSSSSIGFGRGALFIYDSTLIGFASVVAAYFFGLVETRPQNKMQNELGELFNSTNSSAIHYTILKFDGIDYRCVHEEQALY